MRNQCHGCWMDWPKKDNIHYRVVNGQRVYEKGCTAALYDNHPCEGSCMNYDGHKGEVKTVHVLGKSIDWGNFQYCDFAIELDRNNNLEVIVLDD